MVIFINYELSIQYDNPCGTTGILHKIIIVSLMVGIHSYIILYMTVYCNKSNSPDVWSD